jgi:hypothetical protein
MASGGIMADKPVEDKAVAAPETAEEERVPFFQQLLDNPFLLLFLGITFPTVFYIIWGIMEIISIPIAQ